MWNSCLDFTNKEIWRKFTRIEPSGSLRLENIRGQSQVSSKTEDIAELKEIMQMTV